MTEEKLATRVGAGMLLAFAAGAAFLLTVEDCSLRSRVSVTVFFSHVGGLKEGADVQVGGRTIGEIVSIELAPDGKYSPQTPLGGDGGVVIHARIERRYASMTSVNGEWFVNSKGIFGERYLEIGPPAGGAAPGRAVEDGDEIRGVDPARLDRLAAISVQNISTMRALMRELAPEIAALGLALDEITATLEAVQPTPGAFARSYAAQLGLVDEVRTSMTFWDGTGTTVEEVGTLVARSSTVLAMARGEVAALRVRLDALVAEVDRVRTRLDPTRLARFDAAIAESRALLARTEAVLATSQQLLRIVELGQGTIGGFANDHELRDFAKAMSKIIKRQGWELLGHPDMRR